MFAETSLVTNVMYFMISQKEHQLLWSIQDYEEESTIEPKTKKRDGRRCVVQKLSSLDSEAGSNCADW